MHGKCHQVLVLSNRVVDAVEIKVFDSQLVHKQLTGSTSPFAIFAEPVRRFC